ncbi:E3 ubiquitin-protein ligase DCST1 [Sphaeramia orbicularis]|uniref:E3 ubiquitin-protein ligase DCST1 n=1 Tax=Sphaeramia orbicularis TaxID=375764 RepID=UPI00117F2B1F|nr:E3 ubiquitin-protein ligase DCST1 [Sphaeramia orbicularis]
MSGAVLFLGIVHNLPLTFDLRLAAGCVFVALCAVGGALSSSFRCSVLLTFPSMLGSRGRAYLLLFILSVLYAGPISNIQRNVETAALTLSCNLDLQVHHGRLLWRDTVRPLILIAQELKGESAGFQVETHKINGEFQNIRDEVLHQYGYSQFEPEHTTNTTQEQFTAKTMMQCNSVVDQGVQRCSDWFSLKWVECMEAIPVPVINHILCVSMKFNFLCDIMRVMTPWCKEHIPVEGNFGQLFDQVNRSVDLLSREFSTELVLQEEEQQSVLGGGVLLEHEFTEAVKESFKQLTTTMESVMNLLQLLKSFTFLTIFIQALTYLLHYRRDIRFDNVYITSYFRQIDAHRRRAGKRCVLPLKKSGKNTPIKPCSLKMHSEEIQQLTSGVFQLLSISLLSIILFAVDFFLLHVLDIISRHTVTQFNVTGGHQVDIRVGGDSLMARLLRKTVTAFNSSSSFDIHTDNQVCASPPFRLSVSVYMSCVGCVLMVVLLSCIQVYTNRLRRLIAAVYHPEREKRRVLFLYNLTLQRQISSSNSKSTKTRQHKSRMERLSRFCCHLCGVQGQ